VEYGVILSDPGNITVAQGTLETVQLLLTNTGTATDTFELTAASETLGKAVSMETESEEVAAGPLAQKLLKLTLDLPQNASLGPHKVTVTAVSMGADDAGMDVGFNVTFNVVVVEGAGGGENGGDDGGEGAGGGGEEELSQTTVVLVAGLTVAAVLIALSPWLHVWTLFAMAPLMVRYRNGETDRKWKDRIYSSITSNPGVHFTRLKEWLTISNGTLTYNLEILIQEKRIRAVRDGLFKKYYPVETALDRLPVDSLSLEDKIILSVRDNPGAAQSEMAHNLDESRQNVHYHVKKLVGLGILEPEANRDGHPRYRLARTRAARRKLQDIFDRRVELPYGDEAVDTN
jgi:predicted transcriptional regulator